MISGVCKSTHSSRWSDEGHLRREISPVETELRSYGSRLRYQCGLARKFYNPEVSANGTYDERMMQCNWNTSWTLEDSLDPCGKQLVSLTIWRLTRILLQSGCSVSTLPSPHLSPS